MMPRLFEDTGVHALVDGQFGSTGKGLLAAWLAEQAYMDDVEFSLVISNAGPNSGHTFYHEGEKHVLKQLPTFAVASHLMGATIPVLLTAGAVINPQILAAEQERYPDIPVIVHPNAAIITPEDVAAEHSGTVAQVAGTASGTGAAIARKVLRDPEAVWGGANRITLYPEYSRIFMEVSQGFSLGINQRFYPKCTSRECTVSQALADAGLPPRALAKTYMSLRTLPIRVGNVGEISSGGWYPDQRETSWEKLGVEPERTTVTNRVRRIATFSHQQLEDAVRANDPDWIFINFLNYLDPVNQEVLIAKIGDTVDDAFEGNSRNVGFLGGYGPTNEDVRYLGSKLAP